MVATYTAHKLLAAEADAQARLNSRVGGDVAPPRVEDYITSP